MEQSKVQLELDWQQRVGEVERQQSHKHQELIRQLSRARDEVCRPVCLSVPISLSDTLSPASGTSYIVSGNKGSLTHDQSFTCRHLLSVVIFSRLSLSSPVW